MAIVNEVEKIEVVKTGFGWSDSSIIGIVLLMILFILIAYIIYAIHECGWGFAVFFIFVAVLSFITWKQFFYQKPIETRDYKEYQISIKDSDISLNDFLRDYEIIEQNGNILTIKERQSTVD